MTLENRDVGSRYLGYNSGYSAALHCIGFGIAVVRSLGLSSVVRVHRHSVAHIGLHNWGRSNGSFDISANTLCLEGTSKGTNLHQLPPALHRYCISLGRYAELTNETAHHTAFLFRPAEFKQYRPNGAVSHASCGPHCVREIALCCGARAAYLLQMRFDFHVL